MATKVNKKANAPDGSMSLMGHIKEFRNRLIVCVIVFALALIVGVTYGSTLVDLLTKLGRDNGYSFITTSPQEMFLQHFQLGILAALVVTIPVVMFNIWAFAKPGLSKKENFFFGAVMVFGIFLFCAGVTFAYFVTLPFMLNFLITLEGAEYVDQMTSLAEYNSFAIMIFSIFGTMFEMPLLTVILSKMGIANPTIMAKGRGIAIVLIFVVAALITPPDIISQMMVGFPMVILYEISIILSRMTYRKKVEKEEDDDDYAEDEDES